MSTKTTFKRIALVAVAALGFGMLSAVPSSAAATGSIALSTTSLTVVGGAGTTSSSGLFYVDTFDAAGVAAPLESSGESITATVIGKPTYKLDGTTAMTTGDLTIQAVKTAKTADAAFETVGGAGAGAQQIPNAVAIANFASWDGNYIATDAETGTQNRYWFAVYPTDADAVDAGEFTIRVRLVDSTGFISDKSIKVKFVTSAADSGAVVTLASAGAVYTGQALTYTAANKLTATLADANGGKVVAGSSLTADRSDRAPELSAAIVLTSTGVATSDVLAIADTGTAAVDHIADTDYALGVANNATGDGHYGITAAATSGIVTTASTLYSVRVRYGSQSVTKAITILGATTADELKMDLTVTAAGMLAGEELIKSNVDTTTTYTLPLSTKTATIKLNIDNSSNAALASQSMTTKATWSGPFVSADVTPATQTVGTTSTTDASGDISLTVTNATPLDGATATILVTGFAGGLNGLTAPGTRTIKLVWAKAAVNSITVLDPVASVKVLAGSTNVFTLLVKDQFGTAMANEPIQPAITGTTSNNYSATATQAIVTTGAAGTATWSLKDAAAIAGSDALSFTTINGGKSTTASLSYVTTLPVVNTMRVFFNRDATAAAASVTSLVPTTGIYSTDGGSTKLLVTSARNYSRSLATLGSETTDDMNAYKVEALTSAGVAATGAAVTVTASAGGYILGADNLKTTSRTFPVASTGFVSFIGGATGTGAITYTITAGTVSATASAWVGNATADARNVTLTAGATTGEAYSAGVPMTVKVTDRFGNPVSGVTLVAVATGAGSFAGGATTQSYSTDSTGAYTFQAVSNVDGGGAATFTVTAGNATESASPAGYVLSTEVDSTLTAGNKSASASVAFSGGSSPASIAADAAAEATDAANAATDAANAAAEAADAATAAAQDAADAVAALSAQVSSLISGLKSQLTALTNLVIKIQKKVKA